jgi:hypothetical protein
MKKCITGSGRKNNKTITKLEGELIKNDHVENTKATGAQFRREF